MKFTSLVEYKMHLSTEFHVYNAKRRTAQLAPISLTLFEDKKKQLLSSKSSSMTEGTYTCKPC